MQAASLIFSAPKSAKLRCSYSSDFKIQSKPCRVSNKDSHILIGAEKHFAAAVAAYSRAIDINPNNAVYYANRAAAHVRLENFGLALADATKAIEINPQYVKACSSL